MNPSSPASPVHWSYDVVARERCAVGRVDDLLRDLLRLGQDHPVAVDDPAADVAGLALRAAAGLDQLGHAVLGPAGVGDLDDADRGRLVLTEVDGGHRGAGAEPGLDVRGVVEALALAGGGDLLEEPLAQVVVGLEVDLVGERRELAQRPDRLDLLPAARVEVDADVGDGRVRERLRGLRARGEEARRRPGPAGDHGAAGDDGAEGDQALAVVVVGRGLDRS